MRAAVHDRFVRRGWPRQAVRGAFAEWEVPALLDGMDAASDFYADRVSQIRMDEWRRGRVGLAGDAAACVSLLAGEGTGPDDGRGIHLGR